MPVLEVRNKKILYIHIPKTGGSSVENLLRSYGGDLTLYSPRRAGLPCVPQHFHGDILKELFGLESNNRNRDHSFDFIFMTVRHPISRLLSEYRHQRTMHRLRAATALRPAFELWPQNSPIADMMSFDHWCKYALLRARRDPFFSNNHLRPQVEFSVWDPAIYRLEDGLEPIRLQLDQIVGSPGSMPEDPKKSSIDRSGSTADLRSTTLRMIHSSYAGDFAAYGYKLGLTDVAS